MLARCRTIGAFVLFAASAANGSNWVSNFAGSAEDYRVVRDRETIAIEQLMLLLPGDVVIIDRPDGRIVVVDDNNEYRNLARSDTPFVVPESKSPPQLLVNVRSWLSSWWSTRGNQNTSSMAAVSRGGLDPAISAPAAEINFLLSGARTLHVAWQGGIAPFDITLFSGTGEILVHEADLSGNEAILPEVILLNGQYRLQVSAGDADNSVALNVVEKDRLPEAANAILDLDVPAEIGYGHVAMILSAYENWRFEAFQIANQYKLTQLALDLRTGDFPESEFVETTSGQNSAEVERPALQDNP